ncbi:hypothetical protein Tco_1184375 [Tanacetum coccineum]
MELYMQYREHGRMILESVENGPLIWPTMEENGVIRTKKYVELSVVEKIQANCDMKATNIILQGLPADIYSLVNHHRVAKDLWERVQLLMQGFAVPVFSLGDDPIACLNKAMDFFYSRSFLKISLLRQGLLNATTVKVNDIWLGNALRLSHQEMQHDPGVPNGQAVQTIIANTVAFQTEDLDTYDSYYDDLSNAQAVLMANISNYGSDVISEVPHSKTDLNNMENQSVHAMQDFEQTPAMDFSDNEIHSYSNIIPYSQYLEATQQANVQDTHLQAQQDSMILSVIEQMSEQMINHVNNWEKANKEHNNESVTARLERYKERVKTFEQRLNIDLSRREKMIDSQMDDMIKEKLALKEQVDSLEQNLSKQIKEKECLLQTFTVFKSESKEKEDKYMENEIDLEKKIKEHDNILFKVGQSAQTVHMLTKPQAFYDNIHKQALCYQNPFHLKKPQRIKPTLYDSNVMSDKHVAMPVIDDEETLILEEKNFGKRFTPQHKMDAEQVFWLRISNPISKPFDASPVKIEAPKELPKVSLVNESVKKLKFHLARFDNVVKIRTTPDARTEGTDTPYLLDGYGVLGKSSLFFFVDQSITYDVSLMWIRLQEATALRATVLADSPVSTSISQDAPSTSIPSTQEQEHSPNISQGFEESLKTPTFRDDPFHGISLHEVITSQDHHPNFETNPHSI